MSTRFLSLSDSVEEVLKGKDEDLFDSDLPIFHHVDIQFWTL